MMWGTNSEAPKRANPNLQWVQWARGIVTIRGYLVFGSESKQLLNPKVIFLQVCFMIFEEEDDDCGCDEDCDCEDCEDE
jgi:hypothetical protein